jgi:hypothetical protein
MMLGKPPYRIRLSELLENFGRYQVTDPITSSEIEATEDGWPILEVWSKYEKIAMHFNDLLLRLRTQALGAVATLAAIIVIFARAGAETHTNWEMISFAFVMLSMFWVAVWLIDFQYYNRLLQGSVASLVKIEEMSKYSIRVKHIDLASTIENRVVGLLPNNPKSLRASLGRWAFYMLVSVALASGSAFSWYQSLMAKP